MPEVPEGRGRRAQRKKRPSGGAASATGHQAAFGARCRTVAECREKIARARLMLLNTVDAKTKKKRDATVTIARNYVATTDRLEKLGNKILKQKAKIQALIRRMDGEANEGDINPSKAQKKVRLDKLLASMPAVPMALEGAGRPKCSTLAECEEQLMRLRLDLMDRHYMPHGSTLDALKHELMAYRAMREEYADADRLEESIARALMEAFSEAP